MMFLSGLAGFALAWIIVGIVYYTKKNKNTQPYQLIVTIDGIMFVMDTYVAEMLTSHIYDDYDDGGIILNNMIQCCYNAMDAGWKTKHKETIARCGFLVESATNTLKFTITPLNAID